MTDTNFSLRQQPEDEPALLTAVYVHETQGSDKMGDGSMDQPFQTMTRVLQQYPDPHHLPPILVWVPAKTTTALDERLPEEVFGYQPISFSALKKALKRHGEQLKKAQRQGEQATTEQRAKEMVQAQERDKTLQVARELVLTQDPTLSPAVTIKIREGIASRGQRVKISGWVHRLRVQGKKIMFVVLRDGTGYLQCILQGPLCQTHDALTLSLESTISVYGLITELPDDKSAPEGHELKVDYWEVIGKAPGGDDAITNQVSAGSDPSIRYDLRHLVLREEKTAGIIKVRARVLKAIRDHFEDRGLTEVSPPYLLVRLEDLIADVIDRVMDHAPTAKIIAQLHPTFKRPQRPFLRMDYVEAIQTLERFGIRKEDGTPYVVGDDIPEAPERAMTDKIGVPILLCRFPTAIKSFYMKPCPEDEQFTESVDLLMPGVGECAGASMRISDLETLLRAYEREGLREKDYGWYTDQRRFGTVEHGGYGVGVERFVTWILGLYTIRETCLYPRFYGRAFP
ncbi:hypothetical protein BGW38_009966 [Lunasporangiospora selenospora]|uniref:Asparaginyl-tRNA synthetase n=1 Tax=Lunasporangiospora selenospora TaxID=979761 RepID=A0A9P6FWP1_9FUNG|nr:hypothetical protein BGW38_009966 [Lunasporangiospora selenospora]